MRRVTFSRNVTLSLSRTCSAHCKYCSFATKKPHLHEPEEVERLIDRAARRGVKELLVLTGEKPMIAEQLQALGFEDFVAYVTWACEKALDRGLLPHTNLGTLDATDLARLRAVTASQGLMLESTNPDLVAHQGSPTKHPAVRLQDDHGRRRPQDPVHERDPGRHRRVRGGPDGLAGGARGPRAHPGDHPPELRPAPALLRRGAGGDRHRRRRALLGHRPLRRARTATCRSGPARSRSTT